VNKIIIKPVKAFYHITRLCNLSCKHCYYSAGFRSKDELSLEKKFDLIDKFAEFGIRKIDFLGGEPTILPYFSEILDYTLNLEINGKRFKEINVQTNGIVFPFYFLYLKRKPNLIVSIEDSREEFNDFIRGEGSLRNALKTIIFAKRCNFNVIMRASIYQNNDIDGLIKWSNRLGVDLVLTRFYPTGRGTQIDELAPNKERLAEVYLKVLEAQKYSKQTIQISDPQFFLFNKYLFSKYEKVFKTNESICDACSFRLAVDSDGNAYPCFLLMDKEFCLGNFLNDSFEKILDSCKKFIEKRNKLRIGDECYNCPFISFCKGCSFVNFSNNMINDDNCPIPLLIKRGALA
jgi:radical SAM protein with 4Fe4S-binding SPASM domain